ncbi:MAG TPA: hypothetical protein VM187_19140, partial [Niastella sp.]|nr:hypothetical protein [Niastella sp.]
GMQLQRQALQQLLWKEIDLKSIGAGAVYPVALDPENVLVQDSRRFNVKPYSKTTGIINFHSWDPGVNLYSNNILNTLAASIYYYYNGSEKSHTTGIRATYGGFFPVLNASLENTFNRHIKRSDSTTITANESEAALGYNIPLNFTRGSTTKLLNFGTSFVYNQFWPVGISKNDAAKEQSQYLYHFINWAQQRQRARQHIYPKLGYTATLQYRDRLDTKGYQALGRAAVYLPSFATNHSVVLTGTIQQVDTGNVLFSNRFSVARGYPDYYYARMWNASFNYHMPLLYPDWGFANLFYILRVRSNFFFDYSKVDSKIIPNVNTLRSTGTELFFDTKWWNQLPLSFGVRYSYLLDKNFAPSSHHVFEFIVPLDVI